MIKLPKKKAEFLTEIITSWQNEDLITATEADKLLTSYEPREFDWKRLAAYSFWIAIICGIIAFVALIADDWIMDFIENLFNSSYFTLCAFTSLLAAGFYYLGWYRQKKRPNQVFTNEAIMFIGVLLTATAVGFFGQAIDTGSGHFSILILIATIIYGVLGFLFPSKLIWIFSIVSLGSWFGTETGYMSGWGAYFLGMNYPLRFVLFGGILTAAGMQMKRHSRLEQFYESTYVLGLLYLFVALWILSLFGNYGDMTSWYDVKQIELFHWGLISALVAIGAIYYGLKNDDRISRGFGVTFLFINLYTKFFEYFWDSTHKAIFFFIMGVSFWLIGRRAEKIWNMEFLVKKPNADDL